MTKVAIISDIHGNYEALKCVLDDIEARNVDEIICLGDVIGYGPNPAECLAKVLECCKFVILGNHEHGVIHGAYMFNPVAKDAIDWTREQIKPTWLSGRKTRHNWGELQKFPTSNQVNNLLFVHGSPSDPTFEYLLPEHTRDLFGEVPEVIQKNFDEVEHVCFIGHTHKAGIITDKSEWFFPTDVDNCWEIKEDQKIICNVGSVGQPRDNDNRSCYVTVDGNEIGYHRVPYDIKATQEKIERIPELDNKLSTRLEAGY